MIHYQDRCAVVTGASSGLGRELAARLADRGMSLVLTGRNEARLNEVAQQIRRAAPRVKVETVAADLSTRSGVSALLDHVGDRPVEVLVNNAGFGSYGPFAEADPDREPTRWPSTSERWSRSRARSCPECSPGSGGILNVASTIAFQPAPYQAVYGASKAFVRPVQPGSVGRGSFGRRGGHRSVSRPDPHGFRATRWARTSATRPSTRGWPTPSRCVQAGLRALEEGRAVAIPGRAQPG